MALNWQPITGNFLDQLYLVLKAFEAPTLTSVPVGGNLTIGLGFDLKTGSSDLKRGRKMGTFYFSGTTAFRGRPRGRRLASSPRRLAVRMTQAGDPKGVARFTLVRRAASSAAVSGAFTRATQLRGRGTGLSCRNAAFGRKRLDQRQFSARFTNLARNGLRSI